MPHNPLLISKIGGKHSEKLKTTIEAIKKIREKIYSINPSKIILLCPNYNDLENITINQSGKYIADLKEFGNLKIQFEVNGDLDYSTKLKYLLRKNNFAFNIISNKFIDYHSFVPLYYLNQFHTSSCGFPNELNIDLKLKGEFMAIHAGMLDLDYHKKFGELLYEFLIESKEKVLILVCGDFVKRNTDNGKEKDEEIGKMPYKIIEKIKEKKYNDILSFEELKKNNYPWVKPFLMALKAIENSKQKPSIMALDKEFEEMYLTIDFN